MHADPAAVVAGFSGTDIVFLIANPSSCSWAKNLWIRGGSSNHECACHSTTRLSLRPIAPRCIFYKMTAPWLATFSASLRSVGTAVTLAAVGIYLQRRGLVKADGKRTLAVVSQQVTFPLFLFTKILDCKKRPCPHIGETLEDAWLLLIWPAFVVGLGAFVGWIVTKVCRTPAEHVRSVWTAIALANSTGLPITLLTVVHENSPQTTDLGRVDPTLFLSVYLLLYPVLQWGLGGWLLSSHETIRQNVLNNNEVVDQYGATHKGLVSQDEGIYISEGNLVALAPDSDSTSEEDEWVEPISIDTSLPTENDALIGGQRPDETETFCETLSNIASRALQPPVVGALVGMLCALYTPLRSTIVNQFEFIFDGLYSVGQAAVPINMMILGCNLGSSQTTLSKAMPMDTMVGIVIGKLLVVPLLGISTVVLLRTYFLQIPDDIDGAFYLVLMIVFLTPTASTCCLGSIQSAHFISHSSPQITSW